MVGKRVVGKRGASHDDDDDDDDGGGPVGLVIVSNADTNEKSVRDDDVFLNESRSPVRSNLIWLISFCQIGNGH